MSETKTCFVIGPIGKGGSDERNQADWLLEYVIKPVLSAPEYAYHVQRADEIASPGEITDQIITHVEEADLTGSNANTFYELAIRHMNERPVIHMILEGHEIPFDMKDSRTIRYRLDNPKNADGEVKDLDVFA